MITNNTARDLSWPEIIRPVNIFHGLKCNHANNFWARILRSTSNNCCCIWTSYLDFTSNEFWTGIKKWEIYTPSTDSFLRLHTFESKDLSFILKPVRTLWWARSEQTLGSRALFCFLMNLRRGATSRFWLKYRTRPWVFWRHSKLSDVDDTFFFIYSTKIYKWICRLEIVAHKT